MRPVMVTGEKRSEFRLASPYWRKRLLKQDGAIGDFLPLIATRGETGRHALARSAEDFVDIATDYERQQQQKRAAK